MEKLKFFQNILQIKLMNKKETLDLENDVVEILHNTNVKKCYMLRLTNFSNQQYYLIANKEEMQELYERIIRDGYHWKTAKSKVIKIYQELGYLEDNK